MISYNTMKIDDINHQIIVFDEPIQEYYDLALLAASTDGPLAKNYRKPIHYEKEFMTLITIEKEPAIMFGTERDNMLPNNVARGFVRTFVNPKFRVQYSNLNSYRNTYNGFYNLFPQYHQNLGINTIFITRNFKSFKRREKVLEEKLNALDWIKYPEPVMYNNCLQWVFVFGDPSFCDKLPKHSEFSE